MAEKNQTEDQSESRASDSGADKDASASKSEDQAKPSQRTTRAGDTAYSKERLIAESQSFLGHPPHVVAGALHDVDKPYLTTGEAEKLVKSFLDREV